MAEALSQSSEEENEETMNGNFMDQLIADSHISTEEPCNQPPSSPMQEKLRKRYIGYGDTDREALGAVPMKGKNPHEWKKIQKVTFTNWVNDRLGGNKVKDLSKDFKNGVLLIQLLESLSKQKIPNVVKHPRIAAQEYANLNLAFEFMRKEKVKLVGIG